MMEVDPENQDSSMEQVADDNPDHHVEEEKRTNSLNAPVASAEQEASRVPDPTAAGENTQIIKVQQEIEDLK